MHTTRADELTCVCVRAMQLSFGLLSGNTEKIHKIQYDLTSLSKPEIFVFLEYISQIQRFMSDVGLKGPSVFWPETDGARWTAAAEEQ